MRVLNRRRTLACLAAGVLVVGAACSQRDDDDDDTSTGGGEGESALGINPDDCPTDPTAEIEGDTIKLVSSYPQSGTFAPFEHIALGWQAHFDMINEAGGVEIAGKSYQIEVESKDDQYDPSSTSQNIDELMGPEGDQAFGVFSVVGTANNFNIRDTLNDLCVPNMFAATGSPAWGNEEFPWLLGSTLPPYSLEGVAFAQLLEEQKPDAKVGMLVQEDDFGRAYEETFKAATEGTDIEIVKVEKYPSSDTEVTSQLTSLAASGADVFFNGGTTIACPNALSAATDAGWEREITWVSGTCLSKTLMGLAGANGDGVYSMANVKDPISADWADDEAMAEYKEKVPEFQPSADITNSIVAYGWTQAAVLIEALEAAEAPTRLAVMESLRNLEVGDDIGLLLPGTSIVTNSEDADAFMGETVNIVQYAFSGDAETSSFELVGEVEDFEGQTPDVTPEELING